MFVFAKEGSLSSPPIEIVEHCFLAALHGYTRKALNEEPADWVLRQFIILNALAEEEGNRARRQQQQAKHRRR